MKPIYPLILCTIFGLSACSQPEADNTEASAPDAAMRVNVVAVGKQTATPILHLTGTVAAREDVAVGTALSGLKILEVNADVGQRVEKGQVLARLDSVNVQAALRQSEMALAKARSNLNARQAEWREAQATFNRYRPLANEGAVTPQELDQQRLRLESAQANVQVARAEIAQLQSQLTDSRHQRAKAEITAPVSGIISQRAAEAGALTGSDALFHIIQDGKMELAANATADELSVLKTGMPAKVRVRGQHESLSGNIRLISPQMDSGTRLGTVRIALEKQPALQNGAYGEAEVQLPTQESAAALPVQAVSFADDGQAFVMLVGADNRVKRQAVSIGRQNAEWVEIVSGVNAGARVVRNAAAFVSDGDLIIPVIEPQK
jgi:efflux transporter, RND family, MFP subunit